jgi:hypothetical protein
MHTNALLNACIDHCRHTFRLQQVDEKDAEQRNDLSSEPIAAPAVKKYYTDCMMD